MKKSKVVINKSFYLGNLKKDILFLNSMDLIKENYVNTLLRATGISLTKKRNKVLYYKI